MGVRRIVGCMSGSSLDGLDVALVEISGEALAMHAAPVRFITRELGELGERLRRLADQQPLSAGEIAQLAFDFSLLHVDVVRELLAGETADLIAVHGQTVYHAPPWSWQMFNAAPLVHALRTPVVYDLRGADIAAGGQGAPMTPIADFVLFRDLRERRAVVNLGGFANYTWLPAGDLAEAALREAGRVPTHADVLETVRGGDICVCNQLLNAIARRAFNEPFDADGLRAANAKTTPALRASLCELLADQAQSGRSLGTGDECGAWVERHIGRATGEELLRAAVEEIASRIGLALGGAVDRIILAGGGARNLTLVDLIRRVAAAPVDVSDALGVASAEREAVEMAILGALAQDRVPIMLKQITFPKSATTTAGVWVFP